MTDARIARPEPCRFSYMGEALCLVAPERVGASLCPGCERDGTHMVITDETVDEHDRQLVAPLIRLIGKVTQGCEIHHPLGDGETAIIEISLEELLTDDEVALVRLAGEMHDAQEKEAGR